MRFNTHDTTPRRQNSKKGRLILSVSLSLVGVFLLFFAVVCSYYARNALVGVLMVAPFVILGGVYYRTTLDMKKAFVELDGNEIRIVDYYLGAKREKAFLTADVASAQSCWGGSFRIKGYRWNLVGMRYIVFRGENGKYLFKILDTPETRKAVGAFVEITEA